MGDLNLVAIDRVEDEIAEARNNNHARVRLVHLAALIGACANAMARSIRRVTTATPRPISLC